MLSTDWSHMCILGSKALRSLTDNYSSNFAEDRETGIVGCYMKAMAKKQGVNQGKGSHFYPPSNAPSTQEHSLHSSPSNLSIEYQEEKEFERRIASSGNLKTIIYTISLIENKYEHCPCSQSHQFQIIPLVMVCDCT